MKTGLNEAAYTIIEVLIVLAVTTTLLFAVMLLISGQQGKTEFTQAMNDIQAELNDVINNVSTGYYANNNNVKCAAVGGAPVFTSAVTQEGSNKDCVFMGRAVQFAVSGNASSYNVYDVAGVRLTAAGQQPQTLVQASPRAIAPPTPNDGNTTQQKSLQYGLQAAKMYYTQGVDTPINTIVFMSTLAPVSAGGDLVSGTQQVELRPVNVVADISNGATDKSASAAVTNINNPNNLSVIPTGGVTICFNSAGSNQSGIITIGNNGRRLATSMTINPGKCT